MSISFTAFGAVLVLAVATCLPGRVAFAKAGGTFLPTPRRGVATTFVGSPLMAPDSSSLLTHSISL